MRVQNYSQPHQVMLEQEGTMRATAASCAKVGVIVPLVFLTGKLSGTWLNGLIKFAQQNPKTQQKQFKGHCKIIG